jgi:ribosomal protein L29
LKASEIRELTADELERKLDIARLLTLANESAHAGREA